MKLWRERVNERERGGCMCVGMWERVILCSGAGHFGPPLYNVNTVFICNFNYDFNDIIHFGFCQKPVQKTLSTAEICYIFVR